MIIVLGKSKWLLANQSPATPLDGRGLAVLKWGRGGNLFSDRGLEALVKSIKLVRGCLFVCFLLLLGKVGRLRR